MEENLGRSVRVGQRSTGDVDVAWTEIIEDQSHVVAGVYQGPAHLQPFHALATRAL